METKHLGKSGQYLEQPTQIDSSLLERVPRFLSREREQIILPETYFGYDVWHCYESSFLDMDGFPVSGILKIVYSSFSEFIVESKSLKLYLNSFDNQKLDSTESYTRRVIGDLENLLQCKVDVGFLPGYLEYREEKFLGEYKNILDGVISGVEISDYNCEKNHLVVGFKNLQFGVMSVFTDLLRSRCEVTGQKDTGCVYIKLKLKEGIVIYESLLKQIVSFRNHQCFHEPTCEKLFTQLTSLPEVEQCMVMMLYNRRGSLDITPVRSTHRELIPEVLIDSSICEEKTRYQ